jgi:XTP/dITP diphosphohydrolase
VLASNNAGKLRELRAALAPHGIEPVTQGELGIPEAEEPHCTFIENALAKARHASAASGLPALADDSGICVVALGGAPGVHSARFAGEPRSDGRNNKRLLDALHGATDRRAWYHAVLVLVLSAEDPQPLIAEGSWHGEIAHAPRGEGGFGYDPIFWLPGLACTSAELDVATKQRLSHRGQALRALLERLPGKW